MRGREVQGEFYEIPTSPPSWSNSADANASAQGGTAEQAVVEAPSKTRKYWLWAGITGLAGVAGAAGYYVWDQNNKPLAPRDVDIQLNDKP